MRNVLPIVVLSMLVACGGEPPAPDPAATPEGKLCGRAYSSTIDSLEDLMNARGIFEKDRPPMPDKDAYVTKCLELGLTESQLKCIDPKIGSTDETCAETLKPVEEKTKKLADIFGEAMKGGADKKEGEGAEGGEEGAEGGEGAEGAEGAGDAGDAVKSALGE